MKFQIISAFEEMFSGPFSQGLLGTAIKNKTVEAEIVNPRDFTEDVHHSIDDRPFGGGDGMLMSIPSLKASIVLAKQRLPNAKVVYLSPQGIPFDQKMAEDFCAEGELILLCGRYAGIDERLIASDVDLEVSLGDFVMTGAEIAAMAIVDSVSRLQTGVLGNEDSAKLESFSGDRLLEWPQYTRPRVYDGMEVPAALLSGNHKEIAQWRRDLSILRTFDRRPDLLADAEVSRKDLDRAKKRYISMPEQERRNCGLGDLDAKISDL